MKVQVHSNVSAMNRDFERNVLVPARIKSQTYAQNRTKTAAQKVQREWQKKFKRKTPKTPKENRRPIEMLDGNLKPLGMTVSEFIKKVKRKKSEHSGANLEIGEFGAKQLKRKGRTEKQRAIRQQELNKVQRLSGKRVSRKSKSRESEANWTEYALKKETSWIEKSPNSTPGSWPFTWKNIERDMEGSAKRNFPDYYLKNQIKIKQLRPDEWIVYISPYFSGDKTRRIFEVLEHGGTIYKQWRSFKGYLLEYYRLSARQGNRRGMAIGQQYGQKRRRIKPILETHRKSVTIAARPFIKPMEEEMKKRRL